MLDYLANYYKILESFGLNIRKVIYMCKNDEFLLNAKSNLRFIRGILAIGAVLFTKAIVYTAAIGAFSVLDVILKLIEKVIPDEHE